MKTARAIIYRVGDTTTRIRRWLVPTALATASITTPLPLAGWTKALAGTVLLLAAAVLIAVYIRGSRLPARDATLVVVLTAEAVRAAGDELGDWVELYRQWHKTCQQAGITATPSIEVRDGELAAYAAGPDGPILLAGPQLLALPAPVRQHALAHEAAHMISGHHLQGHTLNASLELAPALAYVAGHLAAGVGLLANDTDLRVFGLGAVAVGVVVELLASAWSRDRELAADAIAAHCLGQSLDADSVAAMVADNPTGARRSMFDSHPDWRERHDSVESHREHLAGGRGTTGVAGA